MQTLFQIGGNRVGENDSITEAYDYLEAAWDRGDFKDNFNHPPSEMTYPFPVF